MAKKSLRTFLNRELFFLNLERNSVFAVSAVPMKNNSLWIFVFKPTPIVDWWNVPNRDLLSVYYV